MDDRFKFRAWDKRQKRMRGVMRIDFRKDGDLKRINGTEDPGSWEPLLVAGADWEDEFILMQCTGLKDKNGKLIYEGDIVEWERGWKETEMVNTIIEIPQTFYEMADGAWTPESGKIIGNIYENPELLKS